MPSFLHFACSCGRTLRANNDQMGTEIQCWSCHALVTVPRPPSGPVLRRGFNEGCRETMAWPRVGARFLWALGLSGLLLIPRVGPVVAACGLALFAARLTRVAGPKRDRGAAEAATDGAAQWRNGPSNWILGALAGLCIVAPIVFRSTQQLVQVHSLESPRYPAAAVVMVGWVVGPLLMLHALGRRRRWLAGLGKTLLTTLRHPVALLATALVLPLGLIVLESLVTAIVYEQGYYKTVCVDLFPRDLAERFFVRPPEGVAFHIETVSEGVCARIHGAGLRRGYSIVGALPMSLAGRLNDPFDPRGPFIHFSEWGSLTDPTPYLVFRTIFVLIATTALLTLMELQVRWLGRIAAVEG